MNFLCLNLRICKKRASVPKISFIFFCCSCCYCLKFEMSAGKWKCIFMIFDVESSLKRIFCGIPFVGSKHPNQLQANECAYFADIVIHIVVKSSCDCSFLIRFNLSHFIWWMATSYRVPNTKWRANEQTNKRMNEWEKKTYEFIFKQVSLKLNCDGFD